MNFIVFFVILFLWIGSIYCVRCEKAFCVQLQHRLHNEIRRDCHRSAQIHGDWISRGNKQKEKKRNMYANVSSYQRIIFDISNWQLKFAISHEMRYFYGRIEWPDLWRIPTEAASYLFWRTNVVGDEVNSKKFVKIIVCGWIIYTIWNRINYLWCVNARPTLNGICCFSAYNCLTNGTTPSYIARKRTHQIELRNFSPIDFHQIY